MALYVVSYPRQDGALLQAILKTQLCKRDCPRIHDPKQLIKQDGPGSVQQHPDLPESTGLPAPGCTTPPPPAGRAMGWLAILQPRGKRVEALLIKELPLPRQEPELF